MPNQQMHNHIPALRFPEFQNNGEWEVKRLGEIAEFYKGKGISKTEASDKGQTPCVRYGELYTHYKEIIREIKSFTDIPTEELFLSKANDVVIPSSGETKEDISTASCIMNDNVALGGDINVIRSPNDGVFLSYYLNNAKKNDIAKIAQGVSIIHLYNEQLKNLQICIPSFEEQRKIATCLSSMDELLTATNEKIKQLMAFKKGLMQKLFPAKGKKLPELRFKEFEKDGEWIEKKLGEVTKVVNRRNKSNRNLPIFSISNKEGFILQSEQFDGLDSVSRGYDISLYKIVTSHTFAYNPARINVGSIGYSGNIKECLISSLYVCFKTTEEIEDLFLMYFFDTLSFNQSVENNVEGGIRAYLFYENFSKIKILFPSILEQKRIASCLKAVDEEINAVSDRASELEKQKKGLMQKLFPVTKNN